MCCTSWRRALDYAQLKTHPQFPKLVLYVPSVFPVGDPDSAEEHLARKYNIPPTSWLRIGVESVPPYYPPACMPRSRAVRRRLSNLCPVNPERRSGKVGR